MEFHKKLQELRKQKGVTQEELAEAIYVSRTAVSKWESGRGYPNIDSLKAVAKYFAVTVDDLLSGDELLNVAREDTAEKKNHILTLVFGLLDCSIATLFFLPFFGEKVDGVIRGVSLTSLSTIAPYLKVIYWVIVIGMILWGIVTLAFQNYRQEIWARNKRRISIALNAVGTVIFVISQQPYAAVLFFTFLAIKVLIVKK